MIAVEELIHLAEVGAEARRFAALSRCVGCLHIYFGGVAALFVSCCCREAAKRTSPVYAEPFFGMIQCRRSFLHRQLVR